MRVGDILTVDITSVGMDGEGVARVDGFVLFVQGALLGECVKVQIMGNPSDLLEATILVWSSPGNANEDWGSGDSWC